MRPTLPCATRSADRRAAACSPTTERRALRLRLERVTVDDHAMVVAADALVQLDRLQQTIDHLLAFARGSTPTTSSADLDELATDAVRRWVERCHLHRRELHRFAESRATGRASATALDQILDVLIDNALTHGAGSIRVTSRRIAGGAAIDVADDGSTEGSGSDDELFLRGVGSNIGIGIGIGIGLALARSIADAEGGRLTVTSRRPTTFSLILLAANDDA